MTRLRFPPCLLSIAVILGALAAPVTAADTDVSVGDARAVIEKAGRFYRETLSLDGAYVWRYSPDLSERKGEGDAGSTIGWVQPPGTPAVGAAFLRLHQVTGDPYWLEAAHEAGRALIRTQLASGGWYYSIDMAEDAPSRWCYRAAGVRGDACGAIEDNEAKNRTTLDDNNTQSALRFLLWLDEALAGEDPSIGEAIDYALERIALSQYPNGAWPVLVGKIPDAEDAPPARQASLPEDWPREWVKPEAGPYYILNDDTQRDTMRLFLLAADRMDRPDYAAAAARTGEFLLLAQLPAPQPGWAQTYDATMQPVWGRQFEPPSVASRETAGAIEMLLELYGVTADDRFLQAAREAADWLRGVQLPDGEWARFYELRTDRPLYVDNDDRLTYRPVNLIDHYAIKADFGIPGLLAALEAKDAGAGLPVPAERSFWPSVADDLSGPELQEEVRRLVSSTQPAGGWLEDGWIDGGRFVDAVFIVSRYIEDGQGPSDARHD